MEETFEVRDMRNGKWFWSSETMLKAKVPHTIKLTYFALCLFANKGGECHPGMRTLADTAGISHRSVVSAIDALKETKIIGVKRGVGRDNPNQYTLLKVNGAKVALLKMVQMTTRKRCNLRQEKVNQGKRNNIYNNTNNNRGFEYLKEKVNGLFIKSLESKA